MIPILLKRANAHTHTRTVTAAVEESVSMVTEQRTRDVVPSGDTRSSPSGRHKTSSNPGDPSALEERTRFTDVFALKCDSCRDGRVFQQSVSQPASKPVGQWLSV